jgi:outer membrane protein assembly factor BamA
MRLRIGISLIVCSVALGAQIKPPAKRSAGATSLAAYKLLSVHVTGSQYKSEDVIAASGLRLGQDVTEESFKAATGRLGDTGLFTDIKYAYSYSSTGTKLELELADNTELVPVRFENFVWYSDEALVEKVHERLGLFQGKVPDNGSLLDEVANLLSALVAVHGPLLHATYLRASPSPDSPKINAVVYSVSGAPIQIRKIIYVGANSALVGPLDKVATKLEGGDYLGSKFSFFSDLDARPVYLKRGYLKASFGTAEPLVISDGPDKVLVDVKLPVNEGLQYKVADIQWADNQSFEVQKLQPLIHLKPNQPADGVQLQEDLHAVAKLYGTHGYLKAAVAAEPEFNDAEQSVRYKLMVKQGDLYKLGEVDIDGLDEKAQARLREDWHLREGEPYDTSYPERFIHDSARDLPPGIHWKITAHESINEDTKTVDVTITYAHPV